MAFQCTGCLIKSYDKSWKLTRHYNESSQCFERLFPDKPLPIRFKCSKCDQYDSARKEDLTRHRQLNHHMDSKTTRSSVLEFNSATNIFSQVSTQADTAIVPYPQQIASSSAHQDRVLRSALRNARPNKIEHPASGPSTGPRTLRTLRPTPYLQKDKPFITRQGSHESSDEIERIDSRLISPSLSPRGRIEPQIRGAKKPQRRRVIGDTADRARDPPLFVRAEPNTTVKVSHGRSHHTK